MIVYKICKNFNEKYNILISKRRNLSKSMDMTVTEMVRIQARQPSGPCWLNKEKKANSQSGSSLTENLSEV